MWTKEAHKRFPVLEELQRRQAESYSPVVQNMSAVQVCHLGLRVCFASPR